MTINASKKIKKVSYNQVNIPSGADVSNVTATRDDVLLGKRFVDEKGNTHAGAIRTIPKGTIINGVRYIYQNGDVNAGIPCYVPERLTISVDPSPSMFRHLNPTIIQIKTTASNTTIRIKIKNGNSAVAFTMNWGDSSTSESISTSTSTQTKNHTYATAGTYTIVFTPNLLEASLFPLSSNYESKDLLTFDAYMFNQDDGHHFTNEVSIYCGDSTWFATNSLSYCDNIKVLDFSNMSSLIEMADNSLGLKYFTQDHLASRMCRYSTIETLILGNSISELKSECFRNTSVRNMIVKDVRGMGGSQVPIKIADSNTLPTTITNKIMINHLRLSAYQGASYWSAKSSYMIGY